MKKIIRKQGGLFEMRIYINGNFEYYTDETDTQNTISIMDDKSRIASIRIGAALGDTTPAIKYVLDNNPGSSMVLLDENGTLVNQEEYYPFGETSFGSYAKKRYRYCGKEKDSESGFYYYGARYYAPWLCRFVSTDPKAAHYDFQTPYAYAENNPVTKIDVNGEGSPAQTQTPNAGGGGGSKGGAKHKVAKGDTFWGLEKANHLTHGTLQKLNPGVNPKDLQIGSEINMPGKSSAAPADNLNAALPKNTSIISPAKADNKVSSPSVDIETTLSQFWSLAFSAKNYADIEIQKGQNSNIGVTYSASQFKKGDVAVPKGVTIYAGLLHIFHQTTTATTTTFGVGGVSVGTDVINDIVVDIKTPKIGGVQEGITIRVNPTMVGIAVGSAIATSAAVEAIGTFLGEYGAELVLAAAAF